MSTKPSTKLGNLLIREKLITEEQLRAVLQQQEKDQLYRPLGEILISAKAIDRKQLQAVLRKYKKSISIGKILLKMGLLSEDDLERALEKQATSNKKLGEILVDMDLLAERDLVSALSLQLGIPRIEPSFNLIDTKLLNRLNPEFLLKRLWLPVFREGDEITAIMADPLDENAIRLIEKVYDCKVKVAIAPTDEIRQAIQFYSQRIEMGQTLEKDDTVKDLVIGDTDLVSSKQDDIIEVLNYIITGAIVAGATDIHIEPQDAYLRVRYRIDGLIQHKTDLPASYTPKVTSRIKALCDLDISERRRHQDGRIQARIMKKEYDLRVSTYVTVHGENVVIRVQSRQSSFVDIDKIGFSPANYQHYIKMLDHPSGIILVTGPTGCGKSTTLYASLRYLNQKEKMIITVEDPVEYTIEGVVQGNISPKIGLSYADSLKAMMRQDPDVLMIGEIRDPEAAEAVIQASLTGHKVLSTFHTEDSTGALLRLMDMGIETFLISSTLVSVVAQRLVRVLCKFCKKKIEPDAKTLAFFHSINKEDSDQYTFYGPGGCLHCNNIGYRGLSGIHEVLLVNDAIRNAILKRCTSIVIRRVARKEAHLLTMSEDGFYKALKGITSLEEVIRVVYRDQSRGLAPLSISDIIRYSESTSLSDD